MLRNHKAVIKVLYRAMISCESCQGRICFQVYLRGCYPSAVPRGLLDRGLPFLAGCWSEATFNSLPHKRLHMASCFIRTSKRGKSQRECQNEGERVSKTEVTVFFPKYAFSPGLTPGLAQIASFPYSSHEIQDQSVFSLPSSLSYLSPPFHLRY